VFRVEDLPGGRLRCDRTDEVTVRLVSAASDQADRRAFTAGAIGNATTGAAAVAMGQVFPAIDEILRLVGTPGLQEKDGFGDAFLDVLKEVLGDGLTAAKTLASCRHKQS